MFQKIRRLFFYIENDKINFIYVIFPKMMYVKIQQEFFLVHESKQKLKNGYFK